jgi:hypothetical protein
LFAFLYFLVTFAVSKGFYGHFFEILWSFRVLWLVLDFRQASVRTSLHPTTPNPTKKKFGTGQGLMGNQE